MIKVLVNGALGRMGVITCKAVDSADSLALVAKVVRSDDLSEILRTHQPDVAVDFTLPDCVFANTKTYIEHGVRPVIGTSGLELEQIEQLTERCRLQQLGGIIAPNFSIAAVFMMKFSKIAAKYFPEASIVELHHDKKVDAPSGTAKKTAELLAQAGASSEAGFGSFDHHGISVQSVRLPGLFAHQAVTFEAQGETLTIQHDASDRICMMAGVVMACEMVMSLQTLHYGLENLLIA